MFAASALPNMVQGYWISMFGHLWKSIHEEIRSFSQIERRTFSQCTNPNCDGSLIIQTQTVLEFLELDFQQGCLGEVIAKRRNELHAKCDACRSKEATVIRKRCFKPSRFIIVLNSNLETCVNMKVMLERSVIFDDALYKCKLAIVRKKGTEDVIAMEIDEDNQPNVDMHIYLFLLEQHSPMQNSGDIN
uniref:USP domain-containing protein n=2 Tax=Caenorhabditis tropicalis TaxID=1561998 RepID=A0A1I7T219_9PELO